MVKVTTSGARTALAENVVIGLGYFVGVRFNALLSSLPFVIDNPWTMLVRWSSCDGTQA